MAQDIVQIFLNAPPVTRVLVVAMFVESALVLSGLMSSTIVVFYVPWIFTFPPQLWRLCTPFLLTGGGFAFVFDLYFMWTYASGLELNSPRFTQPGDFFVFVVFLCTIIATTAGILLGGLVFTQALMLAFIYIYAQDNRGQKAHFIVVQIPVEFLAVAMLTLTLVLDGPKAAMKQATGVIAAHMYDFLTRLYPRFQGGHNYIQTPNFIKRAFGAEVASVSHKAYGTGFRPGQPIEQGSGGRTSALGGDWGGRGAGRRLGGS